MQIRFLIDAKINNLIVIFASSLVMSPSSFLSQFKNIPREPLAFPREKMKVKWTIYLSSLE